MREMSVLQKFWFKEVKVSLIMHNSARNEYGLATQNTVLTEAFSAVAKTSFESASFTYRNHLISSQHAAVSLVGPKSHGKKVINTQPSRGSLGSLLDTMPVQNRLHARAGGESY